MNRFFSVLFIFFYPIFASYYYYLPPLTAIAAIFAIRGYEKQNRFMLYCALIYLFNVEVNFSLPMFSTIAVALFYYVVILPKLRFYTTCTNCLRFFSVIIYNILLVVTLLAYDYLFYTESVFLNLKLLYNLMFELLVVFLI
ncbi:MAG: hypothetical protein ACQESH_04525 [Campylobacterota bacterium]